jgi:hypothetical protein
MSQYRYTCPRCRHSSQPTTSLALVVQQARKHQHNIRTLLQVWEREKGEWYAHEPIATVTVTGRRRNP